MLRKLCKNKQNKVRVEDLLTFLLAASNALLQERLAVEGGQGGGCVLLHP